MIKRSVVIIILLAIGGLAVYYFFPESRLPANVSIDKMVVFKSRKQLQVYSGGKLLKIYPISLGFCPVGKKEAERDGKTPEGSYFINAKNPHSICYKNLGISYPNKADILNAKNKGKAPGGDIKIHGLSNRHRFIGKFHRWRNWTDGCIGLTDAEVDELYEHTTIGTPIEIKP